MAEKGREEPDSKKSTRYSRQVVFRGMGESGQARLRAATVAVMGLAGWDLRR